MLYGRQPMHLADAIVYLSGYGFLGSGPATDGRGNRQISTPYKINTPEPIEKKFGTVHYVREGTLYTKLGTNPPTEGFWANG